jgi:serine phosphatase RsbU (regulator of sigma subunit)
VVGVGIGLVLGIDAALDDQRRAERTTRVVDLTEDVVDMVAALQDERARAAQFLIRRDDDDLVAYLDSFDRTDESTNALVVTWTGQAAEGIEGDIQTLIGPIEELSAVRQSILESGGEESAIELYSGLLAPLSAELTALNATEGLARLSPEHALIELVAASESAAVRRTVGVRILGTGEPASREDEILLRVESRRLVARFDSARGGDGVGAAAVEALLASESFRSAEAMVEELLAAGGGAAELSFSEADWFETTTAQIDGIRATTMVVAGELRGAAITESRQAEDRVVLVSVLGGALLFIAVVAAWGAVSASRERLSALSAHTDLVDRLRSWFVPRSFPAVSGVRLEVRYLPSPGGVAAGGDWYDVIRHDDDSVGFVIGDVAGHGPAAVARMAELKNTLRGVATSGGSDPARQMVALDGATASSALLATACYAILDPGAGTLRYCRAGHLPALLRNPGGGVVVLDEGGGPPLGVESGVTRTSASVEMVPGSVLLMFTDGLIEAPGGDVMRAVRQVARVFETAGNDLVHLADLLVAMRPTRTRADDLSLLIAHWTAEGRAM